MRGETRRPAGPGIRAFLSRLESEFGARALGLGGAGDCNEDERDEDEEEENEEEDGCAISS